jgi:hypothetical protein
MSASSCGLRAVAPANLAYKIIPSSGLRDDKVSAQLAPAKAEAIAQTNKAGAGGNVTTPDGR